jgi:hypothetical protein
MKRISALDVIRGLRAIAAWAEASITSEAGREHAFASKHNSNSHFGPIKMMYLEHVGRRTDMAFAELIAVRLWLLQ